MNGGTGNRKKIESLIVIVQYKTDFVTDGNNYVDYGNVFSALMLRGKKTNFRFIAEHSSYLLVQILANISVAATRGKLSFPYVEDQCNLRLLKFKFMLVTSVA